MMIFIFELIFVYQNKFFAFSLPFSLLLSLSTCNLKFKNWKIVWEEDCGNREWLLLANLTKFLYLELLSSLSLFKLSQHLIWVKDQCFMYELPKEFLREVANKSYVFSGRATREEKLFLKLGKNFPKKNVATKLEWRGVRPQWPGH